MTNRSEWQRATSRGDPSGTTGMQIKYARIISQHPTMDRARIRIKPAKVLLDVRQSKTNYTKVWCSQQKVTVSWGHKIIATELRK